MFGMDVKKFYLKEFIEYGKHKSSYFNMPASLAVIIAYLLPGVLGMISPELSGLASLVLIVVAVFERRSNMVKFYCLQFCFIAMFFNIVLSVLSVIGLFIPIVQVIGAMLSLIVVCIIVFVYFYSLFRALQYKAWKAPWVGEFVLSYIMKIKK